MGNMKSQNELIPFACNFHILHIAKKTCLLKRYFSFTWKKNG